MGYFDELKATRAAEISEGPKLYSEKNKLHQKYINILDGWGMTMPYIGQVAYAGADGQTFCWYGEADPHDQIPILVARLGPTDKLHHGQHWAIGVADRGAVEVADDPVSLMVEEAIYTQFKRDTGAFVARAILSLAEIVPSGYANSSSKV